MPRCVIGFGLLLCCVAGAQPNKDKVVAKNAYAVSRGLAMFGDRLDDLIPRRHRDPLFWKNGFGILVDGRSERVPFVDRSYRADVDSDTIEVGELVAFDRANSDVGWVIAFTKGLPPTMVSANWTRGPDLRTVGFQLPVGAPDPLGTKPVRPYSIKVTIWLCTDRVTRWDIQDAWLTTNAILWKERAGFFVRLSIKDAIDEGKAVRADGSEYLYFPGTTEQPFDPETDIGKADDSVNVYFVDYVWDTVEGQFLPTSGITNRGSAKIVMAFDASDDLLVHELGHSLSLADVEDEENGKFDDLNVMFNKTTGRSYLTEGQTFRFWWDTKTVLNWLYKIGPSAGQIPMQPSHESTKIPARHRRVWADGDLQPQTAAPDSD